MRLLRPHTKLRRSRLAGRTPYDHGRPDLRRGRCRPYHPGRLGASILDPQGERSGCRYCIRRSDYCIQPARSVGWRGLPERIRAFAFRDHASIRVPHGQSSRRIGGAFLGRQPDSGSCRRVHFGLGREVHRRRRRLGRAARHSRHSAYRDADGLAAGTIADIAGLAIFARGAIISAPGHPALKTSNAEGEKP